MEERLEAAGLKEYAFRPYINDDLNFIQSSWGSSYYTGANYNTLLSSDEFHRFHRPIRESILKRPSATTIVCCAEKDPNLILGWIAIERLIKAQILLIHYLYVKEAFKKMGIGTELIKAVSEHLKRPVLYSHLTERAQEITKTNKPKYLRFIYTPHLI